jgi:hypothetical protein
MSFFDVAAKIESLVRNGMPVIQTIAHIIDDKENPLNALEDVLAVIVKQYNAIYHPDSSQNS